MSQDLLQLVESLLRIPFFSTMSRVELVELASHLQTRWFPRGETIVQYGEPGHYFFLIRSGTVKVTRSFEPGEEVVMCVLGAGEFFGELALLDGGPRSASVQSLEPTEVLVLYREDFVGFLHAHPAASVQVITVLAERIRRLNDQVEEASMTLPQRLARRLVDLGRRKGHVTPAGIEIHVPLTQSELAGMIGASRPTISRLLADWQARQLIRVGARGEIVILRPQILEALALYKKGVTAAANKP